MCQTLHCDFYSSLKKQAVAHQNNTVKKHTQKKRNEKHTTPWKHTSATEEDRDMSLAMLAWGFTFLFPFLSPHPPPFLSFFFGALSFFLKGEKWQNTVHLASASGNSVYK